MIQPLVDKTNAETKQLGAQTDLTGAQTTWYGAQTRREDANAALLTAQTDAQKALIPGLAAGQGATTAQAAGAGAQSQAQALAIAAGVEQAKLGPLYGIKDKVDAITAQFFRPGVDIATATQQANEAIDQLIKSTVAGTTPYAAAIAAANAGLTQFGTQASLANSAGAAAAQRASAIAGFGGSALSSLSAMNANAPAGSTAMAGAFTDVINMIADKMASGAMAPPGQPNAPALPAILQQLAGMANQQQQGSGGTPGGAGSMNTALGPAASLPSGQVVAPPSQPAPTQAVTGPVTQGAAAPQTSAPVTINIGGAGQSSPNQVPGQNYGAAQAYPSGAVPGAGTTPQPLPSILAQQQPATMASLHQLWGGELGKGAVQSPYSTMGQQFSSPAPMAI